MTALGVDSVSSRSLSGLRHGHALFTANVLDFLQYFELVAKWDAHLFNVFVFELKDCFEIFDSIIHKLIEIFVKFHFFQESLYFSGISFIILGSGGGCFCLLVLICRALFYIFRY